MVDHILYQIISNIFKRKLITMPENAKHGPRLSFSHDFCHYDSIPIEQSPLGTHSEPSTINFDFSIPGGVTSGESSWSAEEFSLTEKYSPQKSKRYPRKMEPVCILNQSEILNRFWKSD